MKDNYKLERELLFKNNIKEITTISLDSNYKINNNFIEGEFVITGDYKLHEISINRESFSFKVPFNHKIKDDIDESTIKLEISNFTYDYKKDELIVNIDYVVTGDRKDVLLFDDETSLDEFLRDKEVEVIDDRIDEIKKIVENENKDKVEDSSEKESNTANLLIDRNIEDKIEKANINIDDVKIDNIELNDEERDSDKTDELIKSVEKINDSFVTYKVHIVSLTDTIESIILKYHITIDELKEYNDVSSIKYNDKLLIPLRHE